MNTFQRISGITYFVKFRDATVSKQGRVYSLHNVLKPNLESVFATSPAKIILWHLHVSRDPSSLSRLNIMISRSVSVYLAALTIPGSFCQQCDLGWKT